MANLWAAPRARCGHGPRSMDSRRRPFRQLPYRRQRHCGATGQHRLSDHPFRRRPRAARRDDQLHADQPLFRHPAADGSEILAVLSGDRAHLRTDLDQCDPCRHQGRTRSSTPESARRSATGFPHCPGPLRTGLGISTETRDTVDPSRSWRRCSVSPPGQIFPEHGTASTRGAHNIH